MRETIQNANGKQFHAVSLSGGKDSTAMLLLMIERDMPINNVIWILIFGWELAVVSCTFGIVWCITLIGIPFGLQFFKFAKIALLPFGSHIESTSCIYP